MQVIPELKDYSEEWYRYLSRVADINKLKTQPNMDLDMNKYCRCIVGYTHQNKIYFDKRYTSEYCSTCKKHSRDISKEYHTLKERGESYLSPFNRTLYSFINHFKLNHNNK